jgi:DNA-binding transcriptional LysR family regulator
VLLSLPQFLVAPFVIATTDLVATLATRVARQFAEIGTGIALHQPPIDLPSWPIMMMWHRRADAHAANVWLRDIIADTAALV